MIRNTKKWRVVKVDHEYWFAIPPDGSKQQSLMTKSWALAVLVTFCAPYTSLPEHYAN